MKRGFSLTELLIALLLLGIIAMFTLPKVIGVKQNQKTAMAKEAMQMVWAAYQSYTAENTPTANTTPHDMIPYMNYVRVDTLGAITIDDTPGKTSRACWSAQPCVVMHNGGVLAPTDFDQFGGTADNFYVIYTFDPDGKYDGSTTGPGKAVAINLYYSGRVTINERQTGDQTYWSGSLRNWGTEPYAEWFTWD